MKKQIKLAMDILKSIPIKADNEIDENENRINLIKKLQENKLNNPLLILKADKLNKEEKNGNIQQGTTTTTAATTDNTRPVDNAVKRFRKVKFGTSTFAGKDSNSNREPNRNDENNHN
jgi:GTP-binding protein EngB required for normal cell division